MDITPALHLYLPDGSLERPVQGSEWAVPDEVEIHSGMLIYRLKSWPNFRLTTPARGMMEQFVKLEGGCDSDFLRYARKWGMLGVFRVRWPGNSYDEWLTESTALTRGLGVLVIYRHHVGEAYRRLGFLTQAQFDSAGPYDVGDESLRQRRFVAMIRAEIKGRRTIRPDRKIAEQRQVKANHQQPSEPLSDWKFWVRKFAAALRIASALSRRIPPAREDWEEAMNPHDHPAWVGSLRVRAYDRKHFEPARAREAFFHMLSRWQDIADLGFWLCPSRNRLEITTDCLFSGLIWQLLSCACGSGGFSVCTGCATPYSPERRPRAETRNYCPACRRRGVPSRDAVRAYRQRQHEKKDEALRT